MSRRYAILLAILLLAGCAWQRIPSAPEYQPTSSLPARVGIVVADDDASMIYGPAIIEQWTRMGLFDSITYPYRQDEPVDAVMRLSVTGGWDNKGFLAGMAVGITLGLASTAVGPSMTGRHAVSATLSNRSGTIGSYQTQVETKVSWGFMAQLAEVTRRTEALHTRKMAVELARDFEADRSRILQAIGGR